MLLDPAQSRGEFFLRIARFGQHGEGGVEFLAAHQIESACDRAGALPRLRFQFMTRFGQIAENTGAEREHIFDETFIGHGGGGARG